jgi:phosphatidylglycerophosphate synthase
MNRNRAREAVFAGWMLGSVALAVVFREAAWCAVGGVIGLGVRLMGARGAWTPSGRFGFANAITLLRLALAAALPLGFMLLPRLAFVGGVLLLLLLDTLDGWVARRRGEASEHGAAFDMETDALTVMLLGLLSWQHEIVGSWVLIAGLWRYSYALFIALMPSLGEAPRSRFGRIVFAVLMLCLAGSFLPLPRVAVPLAALGTALVSLSFVYSLARSRAFDSAATSSPAASSQERGGRRPA